MPAVTEVRPIGRGAARFGGLLHAVRQGGGDGGRRRQQLGGGDTGTITIQTCGAAGADQSASDDGALLAGGRDGSSTAANSPTAALLGKRGLPPEVGTHRAYDNLVPSEVFEAIYTAQPAHSSVRTASPSPSSQQPLAPWARDPLLMSRRHRCR